MGGNLNFMWFIADGSLWGHGNIMKNFGKLTSSVEEVEIKTLDAVFDENGKVIIPEQYQSVTVTVLKNAEGVEWHDLFKLYPHAWYIAVEDDGKIISMESDPEHSQIADKDIWGIDSDFGYTRGPGGTVYGKVWNGSAIVEYVPPITEIPLSFDQFRTMLEVIEKLDAFKAGIETLIPASKTIMMRNVFNNPSNTFAFGMELMTLVAPIVWGADWQNILASLWLEAKDY